jgi:hypothetical protein
VDRYSTDAVLMGISIGLGTMLLDRWVSNSGWLIQLAALLLIGTILCAAQYGLMWLRRRK